MSFDTSSVISDPILLRAYLIGCVLTGGLMCIWGYRTFKYALGLFGLLLAGYLAAATGFHLSDGNRSVALFCGLIGGTLGGVLMVALYLLGVFVSGATLGVTVAAVFTIGARPDVRAVVMSVTAAVTGFLALFIQRFIVIVATALNGAGLVVGGLWLLYTQQSPADAFRLYAAGPAHGVHKYLFVGAWAALGCLGAWAQFSTAGPADKAATAPGEKPRGKRRPWRKRSSK